jgi:hypothetical protein
MLDTGFVCSGAEFGDGLIQIAVRRSVCLVQSGCSAAGGMWSGGVRAP